MCGRFVSATDAEGIVRLFVVDERQGEALPPRYNVAPTDPVYSVVEHDGRRHLVVFRWGLVPAWSKDAKGAARMINARAETVADKPAYRDALARRRCLVPADGFYEWRTDDAGRKQPFYIHPGYGKLLAFAGLWETWRDRDDPDAEPLRTCTIITTDASPGLARIHERMPVALPREAWDAWLDRDLRDTAAAQQLLRAAVGDLAARPVSPDVGNIRNDHPRLLEPLTADG